jgi:hypothetical protein
MSYTDWRDYFKTLAEKHKQVLHVEGSKKKFFESTMEEVLFGIQHQLPSPEQGAFIIFVPYLDRVKSNEENPEPIRAREIMYFIMQSAGKLNPKLETDARSLCGTINDDFIRRFKYDSANDLPIWENSFDSASQVSVLPHEFNVSGVKFVGVQVVVSLNLIFDDCYNSNAWNQ